MLLFEWYNGWRITDHLHGNDVAANTLSKCEIPDNTKLWCTVEITMRRCNHTKTENSLTTSYVAAADPIEIPITLFIRF